MREVYGLELWWALTPWVLLGVAGIACAFLWHMVRVLNRSNGAAQAKVYDLESRYVGVIGQWSMDELITANKGLHQKFLKAETEAREATAAHAECAAKLSRLTPRRNKQGRFAPKGKARS